MNKNKPQTTPLYKETIVNITTNYNKVPPSYETAISKKYGDILPTYQQALSMNNKLISNTLTEAENSNISEYGTINIKNNQPDNTKRNYSSVFFKKNNKCYLITVPSVILLIAICTISGLFFKNRISVGSFLSCCVGFLVVTLLCNFIVQYYKYKKNITN